MIHKVFVDKNNELCFKKGKKGKTKPIRGDVYADGSSYMQDYVDGEWLHIYPLMKMFIGNLRYDDKKDLLYYEKE